MDGRTAAHNQKRRRYSIASGKAAPTERLVTPHTRAVQDISSLLRCIAAGSITVRRIPRVGCPLWFPLISKHPALLVLMVPVL